MSNRYAVRKNDRQSNLSAFAAVIQYSNRKTGTGRVDTSTGQTAEAALIRRIQAGDHASFRILYERHKDQVYTTAVRMLGNTADAEDVLQEIFVKVFRNIDRFECRSKFTTWLYSIAVNSCRDHLRSRGRNRETPIETEEGEIPLRAPRRSTDVSMIIEEEIRQLPEGMKTVFLLKAVEGFSHREIAEILGVSEGSSKSQYFAAKKQLREQLLPYREVLNDEL